MVQFTDLPADIVDKILICLPDFLSLNAAIHTSKEYIYDVFQGHRQTILTAVALNLVGPSLPHAIRLAVWQNHWSDPVSRDDLSYDESMEAATAFLCNMNYEYRHEIEKNVIPIRKLEDMYSQIYKDRRSKTSVLTDLESSRLSTALYRIWQFCISCGDTNIEFVQQWDSGWDALEAQFTAYKLQDLHDIIAVASFLRGALQRCMKADLNNSYLVHETSTLPSIIGNPWIVIEWLEAPNYWRDTDDTPNSEQLPATMFEAAVEKTCHKRGLKTEDTLGVTPGSLVSGVYGVNDKCYGCGEVRGLDLYGRPNWHLLGGILGIASIRSNLPGVLWRNAVEVDAITSFFYHQLNFTWDTFTEELFDVESSDGAIWEKNEWYCAACMTKLYTSQFPSWYIAKPKGAYAPAKEDCWYGWNCRTQIHRWHHAAKLNHFCEPSRGDGKTPEEAWSHQ